MFSYVVQRLIPSLFQPYLNFRHNKCIFELNSTLFDMRKIFLFITFLGFVTLQAQTSKEVTSEITDVTIYLNGAQVTREAEVSIPSGRTELLFKGITALLNSNSLQVGSEKEITILSVNHSIDYLDQAKTDARIENLIQRRDNLQDSIALFQNSREVYIKEREMLLSNQAIGGQETGVDVEQLIRATDFFRERLTSIERSLFNNQQTIKDMQERLEKLNRQLSELNGQKNRPTSTVKVAVTADRPVKVPVQITYTVNAARWHPFYDIRVTETDDPVNLVYRAKVFQNTNEKWKNVNLTLSTGNPSISNRKPELHPWFIDLTPPMEVMQDRDVKMELNEVVVMEEKKKERPIRIKGLSSLNQDQVTTRQQQTTTAFQINIPYSIPSDNKGYDVSVSQHEVAADYQYAAVPKFSPHVYLMAQVPEWNDLNLLPGQANIYFDNTYQGKTYLNPYTSKDTLDISIGRDPGIIVKRELQKDYSSKSMFGNNIKETKAWKITVRNTRNTPATVLIEDQYPVSANSEIKVELEESNGANVNPVTHILNWNLDLKPGEVKELRFVYSVRYPKDMDVVVE